MRRSLVLLAVVLGGCAIAHPRPDLRIHNLDGPPVSVLVNGVAVGSLVCQLEAGDHELRR